VRPLASDAKAISANVELIDRPEGELVEVWLEYPDQGFKTAVSNVAVVGNGKVTYDIGLPGALTRKWKIHVEIDGEKKFEQEFEIK